MTDKQLSQKEVELNDCMRQRRYEDKLLNSRTNLVLTFNSIAAVAIIVSHISSAPRIFAAVIVVVIDVIWLSWSFKTWQYITALGYKIREIRDENKVPIPCHEEIRLGLIDKWPLHKWFGPTASMGIILPLLLLIGWIGGLLLVALHVFFKYAYNFISKVYCF